MLNIRAARWPQDLAAMRALDNSFTADAVYQVESSEQGFRLIEKRLETPLRKSYPLEDDEANDLPSMDFVAVAELDGRFAGFCAVQISNWNRRAVLWTLYVDAPLRGQGIGQALLARAVDYARSAGAWCLWLETQNTNLPAVRFYRAAGFALCGLDTALYDPAGAGAGEIALYFMRVN